MSEAMQHQITDIPIGWILSHDLYYAKYGLLFVEIFEDVKLCYCFGVIITNYVGSTPDLSRNFRVSEKICKVGIK